MMQTSLKAKMMEAFRLRMYFFIAVVSFAFFVIIIQLINLQIVQGEDFETKSRLNMENNVPIPAARGEIYDRTYEKGKKKVSIVTNRPSFNVSTIPAKFTSEENLHKTIRNVSRLLKIDAETILRDIKSRNPWERIVLKEDVDFETVVQIASHQNIFPNIAWEDASVRVYTYGNMFSHVIGYIGSISRNEYRNLKSSGYKFYQQVGKNGIEKQYDSHLRGEDGFVRRIVDVKQRTEGEEVGQQPKAGNNIVLTIDYQIQKTAFEAMGEMRGAVIALRPSTGEIIALVSKPDFDPNLIISRDNSTIIAGLSADIHRPFLNRVIQSKYPPASTFKIITAIAALETERAGPNLRYFCSGRFTLHGYVDHDFYCYDSHGSNDMRWALARSCSVYFYRLGYAIGPTDIMLYARYFGLNEMTGIDIPGEVPGLVPSQSWKLRTYGQPWFDGDTINLSIGQGFLNVTPIAMANFMACIVNDGLVYRPHVVREIRSPDNTTVISVVSPEQMREIPLSPLTLNTVRQGMRLSVTSGTSIRLNSLPVPAAGKTGTAQTRSTRTDNYSQHAWWIGYAPFGAPANQAVVIVVLVEHGVAGAVSAVPVAQRMFARMYELGYFQ